MDMHSIRHFVSTELANLDVTEERSSDRHPYVSGAGSTLRMIGLLRFAQSVAVRFNCLATADRRDQTAQSTSKNVDLSLA